MEKTQAQKAAAEAFALSPDAKEMHVTSDGTCFTHKNDANQHAFTLKDKEIITIAQAVAAAKEDKAASKAAAEKAAAEKAEAEKAEAEKAKDKR